MIVDVIPTDYQTSKPIKTKMNNNLKLHACYLGGAVDGFNIEVHDLVFAVGVDIEDCLSQLRAKWKGNDFKPHLDSYCVIESVKGYKIQINQTRSIKKDSNYLFALYLGWSQKDYLGEKHCVEFAVAQNELDAIKKVNSQMDKSDKDDFHVDNRIGVDGCINIQETIGYNIDLIPCLDFEENKVINWYKKI
jgi:hypothetical protein